MAILGKAIPQTSEMVKPHTSEGLFDHLINRYFPKSEAVWSGKRKTPESAKNDEIAVKVLLNIIRSERYFHSYQAGAPRGLWVSVASEMSKLGFNLGDKPRDKIANKMTTLMDAYRSYKKEVARTGGDTVIKPPFYDKLDDIEGSSHATPPPC
jgi:hypothetical protein